MNLLQYTSKEMVSSTELIRKSKKVFDAIQTKQIDKAIILRDGKPSFMLLDFEKYEEIIAEYIELKEEKEIRKKARLKKEVNEENKVENKKEVEQETSIEDINDEDLKNALAQIEELQIEKVASSTMEELEKKDESLKEFWD